MWFASKPFVFSTSRQHNAPWLYCCAMSPFAALTALFVSPRRRYRGDGDELGAPNWSAVGSLAACEDCVGPESSLTVPVPRLQHPDQPGLWWAGWLEVESDKLLQAAGSFSSPHHWPRGELTDTWLALMKTFPVVFSLGKILKNCKVVHLQEFVFAEIAKNLLFNLRNINLQRLNKVGRNKKTQRGSASERLADLAVPP